VTVRARLVPLATNRHWSSSGEDTALVMRQRGFDSGTARSVVRCSRSPATPTYCGGTRAGTGRRLLIALAQVRFLPPQLTTIRKGKPTGDGNRLESGRAAMPWEFNSPSFRLHVPLAERQRLQPSKRARPTLRVGARFDSRRALSSIGDRLTVGCLALNQVVEVQILLPELRS
jgi:hypothetical protein